MLGRGRKADWTRAIVRTPEADLAASYSHPEIAKGDRSCTSLVVLSLAIYRLTEFYYALKLVTEPPLVAFLFDGGVGAASEIENTSERSEPMTERSAGTASAQEANPIRSSFSMGRYEREAIRQRRNGTAQRRGTSSTWRRCCMRWLPISLWNDVVNDCRAFDRLLIRLSGRSSSIRSTAPHLGWAIDWTVRTVQEICEIEELAISNRWIHGVEIGDFDFDFIRALQFRS